MSRVLITGVAGFIGSNLASVLAKKGYEVYGIDRPLTDKSIAGLKGLFDEVTFLTADISNYQSVFQVMKSVDMDVVVHLAAQSSVMASFEKPFSAIQTNVVGTLNIAYAMMELPEFKKRKLVYASTAEVYGMQGPKPITEDATMNPTNPHANTKAMMDMYLRMMSRAYGLNVTVMRCANTYGREQNASFFIEYVVTNMLKGNKVYLGAPDSVRSYMHINDHVNAYAKAIEHMEISGEAFNAGVGNALSNKELAFKIADMVDYKKENIILGDYPPGYPARPFKSDQPFVNLDCTKIKKMLGWEPKVSLDAGSRLVIDFWRKKLKL